ncbi:MAG: hypothetical protein A2096_05550 [Spirochaetes bacterium GWF1_41_5]|nr:MAG: hypothetical protein A2096_05550 [Spirochaetes bacterium GWF1_41_5]
MKKIKLGLTGIEITKLALGTWVFGGAEWGGADDSDSIDTLNRALDSGINFFDTALAYGDGHAEQLIGKILKPVREKVVIASKAKGNYADVTQLFEKSLGFLGMEYIDLYYIHWPPEDNHIEKMIEKIAKLQTAGKIRAIGLSNFTLEQIRRAMSVARIDALQMPYNLFWRYIENDIKTFCQENSISIISYSPLSRGLLSGKFTSDWKYVKDDNRETNVIFRNHFKEALNGVEKVKCLAEKKKTTTAALAIKWIMQKNWISSILIGARTPRQLQENLNACQLSISDSDYITLDEISNEVFSQIRDAGYSNPFSG